MTLTRTKPIPPQTICRRQWTDGSSNRMLLSSAVENLRFRMTLDSWEIVEKKYGGRGVEAIEAALVAGEKLSTPCATFSLEAT